MRQSERVLYVILGCYACCLLVLHTLYYAGLFVALDPDPQVMIHATRTGAVTFLVISVSVQIFRGKPYGLLLVAAASYASTTFLEDFLVLESSFFLPKHALAGTLYALRPLFLLMLVYWAVRRRSIETA